MAIQEHGVKKVLEKISVEPSGDAFNSISLYPESGRPFNPMINAGAIAATDLVWQHYKEETFDRVLKTFSTYAGSPLELDMSIYNSGKYNGTQKQGHCPSVAKFQHTTIGSGCAFRCLLQTMQH
jgi:glutaminase